MDLLTGNIRTLYFKFLSAAFGSALISCIYGMVDMAMVGQYQGPDGAAALAVVAPVWNIIYSLGLLTGIGGSVLFSARRGGGHAQGEDNQYFTAAVVGSGILAVLSWAWILLFEREVLLFFGADETLLPLAQSYLKPVSCVFPVFLLSQLVSSFLRNDNRPGLATAAVLTGGTGYGEEISEAACMYDYLTAHGVEPGRLILEDQATNTAENFALSKPLLYEAGVDPAEGRVAVVTNDFHIARAELIAAREGYGDVAGIPAPLPWVHLEINYTLREAFAMVKTFLFD